MAISYRIIPSVNWSERWSTEGVRACSGDMYCTVPSRTPAAVRAIPGSEVTLETAGVSFARPKSRIFTRPSLVTMRFSGLRSRCTMPPAWALARASAIWVA